MKLIYLLPILVGGGFVYAQTPEKEIGDLNVPPSAVLSVENLEKTTDTITIEAVDREPMPHEIAIDLKKESPFIIIEEEVESEEEVTDVKPVIYAKLQDDQVLIEKTFIPQKKKPIQKTGKKTLKFDNKTYWLCAKDGKIYRAKREGEK